MQDTPTIHPLDALIREICGSPEAERFGALSAACQKFGGTMIRPGSASHMHEISVLGVYSRAADRQELVLNWLRTARALHVALTDSSDAGDHLAPQVAIEYHPAKRGNQIADATAMIARTDHYDDSHLISACAIILANSHDHCARERAKAIGPRAGPLHARQDVSMTIVLDIRKIEASARLHRQRRMAKRRLLVWRAVNLGTAILIGATLALAIHDAPAKIAATVLDAQHTEGW